MKPYFVIIFILGFFTNSFAQKGAITGNVISDVDTIAFANITLLEKKITTIANKNGAFTFNNLPNGKYTLQASAIGYNPKKQLVTVIAEQNSSYNIRLEKNSNQLSDVVISGTLKAVRRLDSPVPVEVYSPAYFKKNPTACLFDALQNINGVRPQLNCNICNTGDIHINGLEGPYTMVLIDGMPIVSSLATVYGLSGIPNSLVERIEIVKGPASSLYGSEAVGGLINVITKKNTTAPLLAVDVMTTSWLETNADIAFKQNIGKKISVLIGINLFHYNQIHDNNNDQFTDVTLQKRASFFQKWQINRKSGKQFSVAARYMYEDRWGGDVRWTKTFRGGDSIYGESIYTNRYELLGNYQLPIPQKVNFAFSLTHHQQDSRYGNTIYNATQRIAFSQLTFDTLLGKHNLLVGAAMRYTWYDDNTVTTYNSFKNNNQPDKIWLPGVFVQDEISVATRHSLLMGLRYDYNSRHGNIITPRLAYKWQINGNNLLRLNAGTGFRVVNLFTEDHAALTGAREVVITEQLKPEESYNANLNFAKKIASPNGNLFNIELSAWYTHFTNRIIADYETDPNKILYNNLKGYAQSKGLSANVDAAFTNGIKCIVGMSLFKVSTTQNGITTPQILTENFTATWAISYKIKPLHLLVDYTGNLYSPMRLPLLGPLDPRQANSPTWSLQNIQFTYTNLPKIEVYFGVKNLLNFLPSRNNPFIIARSHDPFDKQVTFGANGQVIATPQNPYALTFDPNYVFAPNQGIRGFIGYRFTIQ